jgi:hypothetical protein
LEKYYPFGSTVVMDMDQNTSNPGQSFRIQLQGTLISSTIDWWSDVTIDIHETGGTFLLSLTLKEASLHDFLDQFQSYSLTILPDESN